MYHFATKPRIIVVHKYERVLAYGFRSANFCRAAKDCVVLRRLRGDHMRSLITRSAGAKSIVAVAVVTFFAASASAATIVVGAVQVHFGDSFPDPATWALMLLSFGLIGAGVRSRKRSVVLA